MRKTTIVGETLGRRRKLKQVIKTSDGSINLFQFVSLTFKDLFIKKMIKITLKLNIKHLKLNIFAWVKNAKTVHEKRVKNQLELRVNIFHDIYSK